MELCAPCGIEVVDLSGANNPKIETFTANLGGFPLREHAALMIAQSMSLEVVPSEGGKPVGRAPDAAEEHPVP